MPLSPKDAPESPVVLSGELSYINSTQRPQTSPYSLATSQISTNRFFSESRERLSPEPLELSPGLPESDGMDGEHIKRLERRHGLYSAPEEEEQTPGDMEFIDKERVMLPDSQTAGASAIVGVEDERRKSLVIIDRQNIGLFLEGVEEEHNLAREVDIVHEPT